MPRRQIIFVKALRNAQYRSLILVVRDRCEKIQKNPLDLKTENRDVFKLPISGALWA
jgi:hypothetical protein